MEIKLYVGKVDPKDIETIEQTKQVINNPESEFCLAIKILNAVLVGFVKDIILEDGELFYLAEINEKYKDIIMQDQNWETVPMSKSLLR